MTFASICSGVEGMGLGFHRAGYEMIWGCEIDRQCREVVKYHYPNLPIHHDMLNLDLEKMESPSVLSISAPCQAFSCAGLRGSLDDARGNLTLASIKIAHALNPKFVISENVPGILSTADNAFGCFIGGMVGADAPLVPPRTIPRWKRGKSGEYFSWPNAGVVTGRLGCVCWRILDSQFFGVGQRRERCYVVASFGNNSASQILLERKSSGWNHPQSRGAGEDIAPTLESRARSGGIGTDFALNGGIIESPQHATNDNIAHCVAAHAAKSGDPTTDNYVVAIRTSGNCGPFDQGDKTEALNTATDPNQNTICFEPGVMSREGGHQYGDLSGTIRSHAGDNKMSVAGNFGVRRLTPRECEILQSWPPDWTRYAVSEKTGEVYEQADAPRYRQAGNGVTSNVSEFIARRIKPFIK